ncbi:hypothetical protein diail_10461 [Diaporthe ilicicola]|nr:hypothetical protein diail_10461 [Diaporthe ilicicola]
MDIDDFDGGYASDHSTSEDYAFDLPRHGLRGLRIFNGFRREDSIESGDRGEWRRISDEEHATDGHVYRSFLPPWCAAADQLGRAIDLSLRMMETPKSVKIMAGVARRLVDARPGSVLHITPQSTKDQIEFLVKCWLAKLRHQEFFKIQVCDTYIHTDDPSDWAIIFRAWERFVNPHINPRPKLNKWYPHNAGLIGINEDLVNLLIHHFEESDHPDSPAEWQKCLFYVASLITNCVQKFWVHFLMPNMSEAGTEEPEEVHSAATHGLITADHSREDGPDSGRHWEAEFFGGALHMHYLKRTPFAEIDENGAFGRFLSIGTPILLRGDRTYQRVKMDSIVQVLQFNFPEGWLGTYGDRVTLSDHGFMDHYDAVPRG